MLKSNYALEYLNKKIELLASNYKKQSHTFGFYANEDVRERLLQSLCYAINLKLSYILQKDVEKLEKFEFELFTWNILKGSITLHRKKLYIHLIKAIYRWSLNLFYFFATLFKRGKIELEKPLSLIHNVGGRFLVVDGCINAFEDFLKDCPLSVLDEGQVVFVGGDIDKNQGKIVARKDPFRAFLEVKNLTFMDKLALFFRHMRNGLWLLSLPILNQKAILFAKDLVDMAIIETLDRKKLIKDLMFLHSLSGVVPIWASFLPKRSYKSHMVWYSVNSRPLLFKDQPIIVHQPLFKYNNYDTHWVWTEEEKKWVKDCQGREVNAVVCGPILFGQDSKVPPVKERTNKVLIFDTPPHKKDFKISSDSYLNYVTLDVSVRLVKDLVDAVEKLESETGNKIEVLLKPKKKIGHKAMIPEYYDYLNELIDKKRLTVLPLDQNIAEIISTTDCLVAHPFSTSTKYAHHIGKIGAHYDPTGKVLDDPYDGDETVLIGGPKELESFIREIYS